MMAARLLILRVLIHHRWQLQDLPRGVQFPPRGRLKRVTAPREHDPPMLARCDA